MSKNLLLMLENMKQMLAHDLIVVVVVVVIKAIA